MSLSHIKSDKVHSLSFFFIRSFWPPVLRQGHINILCVHMRVRVCVYVYVGFGFLERENATIVNASLRSLASHTIPAFQNALSSLGLTVPFYLSQNDGTLITAGACQETPILTFSSGPTNSMRGQFEICHDASDTLANGRSYVQVLRFSRI